MDSITISKGLYDRLVADSNFLERLRAAGVDNWDGYSMAQDEEEDEESEEDIYGKE